MIPVMAGVLVFPELLSAYRMKAQKIQLTKGVIRGQLIQGIKDSWKYKWDGLRGGLIGGFVGLVPGIGGNIADWFAYSQTVAVAKKEGTPVGQGNVRGVIGCEGANNAQKATSMIPTVLFGIPGAPFAAVIMALFMYLGFELGTPDLAQDERFFDSLTFGFMWATVLVGVFCLLFTRYISAITRVPYKYYFPLLIVFITWACVQYTGGWEDYFILAVCSVLGILCKKYKFSRPAMVIGFILAERVEALTLQVTSLYSIDQLITRPIFVILLLLTTGVFAWGITTKRRLSYA